MGHSTLPDVRGAQCSSEGRQRAEGLVGAEGRPSELADCTRHGAAPSRSGRWCSGAEQHVHASRRWDGAAGRARRARGPVRLRAAIRPSPQPSSSAVRSAPPVWSTRARRDWWREPRIPAGRLGRGPACDRRLDETHPPAHERPPQSLPRESRPQSSAVPPWPPPSVPWRQPPSPPSPPHYCSADHLRQRRCAGVGMRRSAPLPHAPPPRPMPPSHSSPL